MDQKHFRSGELARLAGVSADLVRHYEQIGVLPEPARSANGYRRYPAESAARIQVVQRALAMGFSLGELARIFAVRDRGGAPCRKVRELVRGKLRNVEERLAELKIVRRQLRQVLSDWDRRLKTTPPGRPAGLLDSVRTIPFRNGRPGFPPKKGIAHP